MSFKLLSVATVACVALSAQSSPGDCTAIRSRGSGRLLPWLFSLKQLVRYFLRQQAARQSSRQFRSHLCTIDIGFQSSRYIWSFRDKSKQSTGVQFAISAVQTFVFGPTGIYVQSVESPRDVCQVPCPSFQRQRRYHGFSSPWRSRAHAL
jgi:hypothetical protein